jgi:hypothetical protein
MRSNPCRVVPKGLPCEERVSPLADFECSGTRCGESKKPIAHECSERGASTPVGMSAEAPKHAKRARARCEELGVSTAPVPAASIEKRERVGCEGVAEQSW